MTDPTDFRVLKESLLAAARGPFFADWEFNSLFGLERAELEAIAEAFLPSTPVAGRTAVALQNAVNNLAGYPHHREEAWDQWLSVTSAELQAAYSRWRVLVPESRAMSALTYIHLAPGNPVPALGACAPFRAVVVVESRVTSEWQSTVSDWLVRSGCLYMMAWGLDCSSWDDSVDTSNAEAFDYGKIPDERFVVTTWHADEPLGEVFWFAKNCAFHPTIELSGTIIIRISPAPSARIIQAYDAA
jgi:hypothetical protein